MSALIPRFVLDVHLGRLAAYIRMLGFDALYRNDLDDSEILGMASEEGRIVLTRDHDLLRRAGGGAGCLILSTDPSEQLRQVVRTYNLMPMARPFTRCLRCNGTIRIVEKSEILESLEPLTTRYYDEFYRCESCRRVYWKGSHHARMMRIIEKASL